MTKEKMNEEIAELEHCVTVAAQKSIKLWKHVGRKGKKCKEARERLQQSILRAQAKDLNIHKSKTALILLYEDLKVERSLEEAFREEYRFAAASEELLSALRNDLAVAEAEMLQKSAKDSLASLAKRIQNVKEPGNKEVTGFDTIYRAVLRNEYPE